MQNPKTFSIYSPERRGTLLYYGTFVIQSLINISFGLILKVSLHLFVSIFDARACLLTHFTRCSDDWLEWLSLAMAIGWYLVLDGHKYFF